jgi:hypothetical protein
VALSGCSWPGSSDDPDATPIEPDVEHVGGRPEVDVDPSPFNPDAIHHWSIEVDPAMIPMFNQQSGFGFDVDDHIPEWFESLTFDPQGSAPPERFERVGARIAGEMNWTAIPGKSAWAIDLDQYESGQAVGGYDKLRFRNMLYGGRFRERFSYGWLFPHFQVPAAQSAYMWLSANWWSPDLKLDYLLLEPAKEDMFDRLFGQGGWVAAWEGSGDFSPGGGSLPCQDGACDPAILSSFADLLAAAPPDQLLEATASRIDWPTFWRFWAAEMFMDHWDGYSNATHNFFVVAVGDPSVPMSSKIQLIPHGIDLVMNDKWSWAQTTLPGDAFLSSVCWRSDPCRAGMLDTLESFAVELDPVQVSAELDDLNRFLGDNEMIYPEDPEDLASFRSWLAARPDTIVALVDAHRDRCVAWAASRWTGWPMEQGDCTSLPVDTGWNDTGGVPIPIDKPAVP